MKWKNKFCFVAVGMILTIGCTKIESGPLRPEDIYLSSTITEVENSANGQKLIHCSVTPRDLRDSHQETIVVLVEGDRITCNGVTLDRVDNLIGFTYEADVPVTSDNQYFLTFYKSGQAYSTARAQMPRSFEIESPVKNFLVGIDDETLVRITPNDSEEFEMSATLVVTETEGKQYRSEKAKVGARELLLEPLSVSEKGELPKVDAFAKVRVTRTGKVAIDSKFVGNVWVGRSQEIVGQFKAKK